MSKKGSAIAGFEFPECLLLPIDFSPQSTIAARYAFEFAKGTGARIRMIHVIESPYEFPSRKEEYVTHERMIAKMEMEKIRDGFLETEGFEKVEVEIELLEGPVTNTLLSTIRENPLQLIVMGLSAKKDLNKVLFGSVTNRILIESKAPVFAVSDQVDYRSFERLVFATDFRSHDTKLILRCRELADAMGADLECVHFLTPKENTKEIYSKRAELEGELDYKVVSQLVVSEDFVEGVSRYLKSGPPSLLVISRYKTGFFKWLLSTASAAEIATIARVPLIMMPGEA